jgi:hypothetical protein
MDREGFKGVISRSVSQDKIDINLKAYDMGEQMVKE